ncbi:MAG: serine--tRNA ligase [Candidatus Caenarcaniphilales bacterium]|nr:serine--tRNA ligase [Candidatus Caenarcaniphilales bacterium]
MLDLKLIRQNPEEFKTQLSRRNPELVVQIDEITKIDEKKREFQKQTDDLKSQRNSLSKSVKSKEEAEGIKEKAQIINNQIAELDKQLNELDESLNNILAYIPNTPQEEVPTGRDENENVIVHTKGEIPKIENPLTHYELGETLGIIDFERTAKLSGARFSSFLGWGAKLQRAIIQFMLDEASNAGYLEISPPVIINASVLQGTGQLPKFKADLYHLEPDPESGLDQYLIPTAEVPLTGFFASENALNIAELPKRLCAYTPCFRSEAGAAGKDTRGLIRQHQFDKIELVHICLPEESTNEHEKLSAHAESLLEKLGLPFRRLLLCTGDIGFSASKCYDLEVWLPSQGKYREISSCSNCTDFQARRLNLRFKRDQKSKPEFLHTLNGSGLAVGRTWAAIVENYQTPDGRGIVVPEALRKYLGTDRIS